MQIELSLGDPSFTMLHSAGLAGLWMTLNQLDREGVKYEGLSWKLTDRSISLTIDGSHLAALRWLLSESFQLQDGTISLRGLDAKSMRIDALAIVHQGILGTFLQHNSTHKSAGTKTINLELDEHKIISITSKSLNSYAYQDFAASLCDKNGELSTKPINVAGWLNPGAAVRHVAFSSNTSISESAINALLLLFAPVACYYYILRSKLRDKRAQYALVIPEITNLAAFAKYKQNIHSRYATYQDFHASSLGDAGLRFLTYDTTLEILGDFNLTSCQVITLGTVAWSTQQKTRTDVYTVTANESVCKNYKICRNELPEKVIDGKTGAFIAPSFARELISDNLARSQPWYTGFADKVNSNELFKNLTYERGGLYQVIQKIETDEREKLFVRACHEAIRYTYGKLAQRAGENQEVTNFDRETIRIRTGLGRCKSASSFREFITDFWSRAGRIPTLQNNWEELMSLIMDEKEWKKGRDLALLALASYKKEPKPEVSDNGTLESSEAPDPFGDD
jgi:CRISPR-associated protein Cas8a1/Csx13